MRMWRVLALLSVVVCLCGGQKGGQETSLGDKGKTQCNTCSNLTQVLDNWKYAIMTQVKDLLVNDHTSVLPEYSRIQPLSEAMGDLYKQFNALKEELGRLTSKFDRVEVFVDDLQAGKLPPPPVWTAPHRPVQRLPIRLPMRAPLGAQMRAPLGAQMRAPLGAQMRAPLGAQMRAPVRTNSTALRPIGTRRRRGPRPGSHGV
ncbi:uncharacterized protein si:dkey-282h22.5 [Hypomesus transpacificus]|uniref:uncharacterized protein si:dkey-282h22.5 n=1 Tax=Hypomesus transpacificus TaxID=137520 RepID=UPI001F07D06B|nr:uncharacterized protein si:dkey-282h22.5 [Hypomesus transpacificus]XP_046895088.1 uncharacterized protein si:dkey-282h22.5 [Hypomesus transpacificus]